MQALKGPNFITNEFTDMDSNYLEWEKNFFSDDIVFSDSESDFTPPTFIKSSQNSEHTIAKPCPMEMASLCKIKSNNKTITTLLCKGMSLSELNTIKEYNLQSAQNLSQNVSFKQGNINISTKRKSNNSVCSENLHTPIKKFKAETFQKKKKLYTLNDFSNEETERTFKSVFKNTGHFCKLRKCEGQISVPTQETAKSLYDSMIVSSRVISSRQMVIGSNQENCDSQIISNRENSSNQKITTLSQENSSSQKLTTSSQDNSRSQKMIISSQSSDSQRMTTSSQSSSSHRMLTSSQSSNSQMITSSQSSISQMITSSQSSISERMTTSSQENFSSQNMTTSSQESSSTQKMITLSQEYSNNQATITSSQESAYSQKLVSSQERLSVQVMNISIQERLGRHTITAQEDSVDKKLILKQENDKTLQKSISNQQNSNKKLQINEQQNLCSSSSQSKRVHSKIKNVLGGDISNKLKQSEIVASTVSIKKPCNQCGKERKKMNWRIRKRELSVTERENAMKIRQRQLDEREANLLKREKVLKVREKRYLMQRVKMKGNLQNLMKSSKERRKYKREKILTVNK